MITLHVKRRRRGTAIVDTPSGILVTSEHTKIFLLPGGGAEKWESRKQAALRELREETGLFAEDAEYLFSYQGVPHKDFNRGHFRDHHKVFLVKSKGTARPCHEIKKIAYYKNGNVRLSTATREIVDLYHKWKQDHGK